MQGQKVACHIEIRGIQVPGVKRAHFTFGLVGSLVGALFGAAVWSTIAILTEREFVMVAWGLGLLAGLGMNLGYGRHNVAAAGVSAALIAVIGIVTARAIIVTYVCSDELAPLRTQVELFSMPPEKQARIFELAVADANQKAKREHRCL